MPASQTRSPIDRRAPASVVAAKFGGLSRLAGAIGKSPSTVHRWLVKGHIDGSHHAAILAAARIPGNLVSGAELLPIDFLDARVQAPATPGSKGRPAAGGDPLIKIDASHTHFPRPAWASLRSAVPLTLTEQDVSQLRGFNDPTSLTEVEEIYLPLTRLINLHIGAARGLARVTDDFVGRPAGRRPYVVAIAGSVAVGKSTTARLLRALLSRWPDHPRVELVTTDGFLLPNATLEARGLMERKGFPESYDVRRMIQFLADIRTSGRASAPIYSHHVYDIVPGEAQVIDQPDILIFEGLNVLQLGIGADAPRAPFTASDFFDLSIFIDAAGDHIARWYEERFMALRATAFTDPHAFFHPLAMMPYAEAIDIARRIWREVNAANLVDNILPSRPRADVILHKGADHQVEALWLRRS